MTFETNVVGFPKTYANIDVKFGKFAGLYFPIVNPDMVWKPGELQSVYNELSFCVELASPCTNLLKFCLLIFQYTVECFGEATLLDDCFIIPKIHCLHRAQLSINNNKKIEQRRWPSLQTISRLTLISCVLQDFAIKFFQSTNFKCSF